ncbi:MAG: threonine ammonia-lyase [Tissierellia bacterium]|nr:threonine ammonia-lyase [Tissierellia bacterium]
MFDLKRIEEAAKILEPVIKKNPIIQLNHHEKDIYLKCENLQLTGSFKLRGALHKTARLSEEEKSRGVIACSAGNHAQGVALSATRLGIPSTICLPASAPLSKVEATKGYGGSVVLVDGVYDDAYQEALRLRDRDNLTFIHPFNDPDVMAGQGTIGLEIIKSIPDLDTVVVSIGGGGLISGVAVAVKSINPNCKVIGVQASKIASMKASVDAGAIVELPGAATIADGIAVKKPGDKTYEMVQKWVDEIVTVDEEEIAYAMLYLMERNKMVSEGAGAATVAAVLYNKVKLSGKTCCLISGGNVDMNIVSKIISLGSFKSGRLTEITTPVPNKPGELMKLLGLLKEMGTNILTIDQFTDHVKADIDSMVVRVVVESRNEEHRREIYRKLSDAGYCCFSL